MPIELYVLELIYTDICGSFSSVSWNDQQYFISFIDEYTGFGHLYLISLKFGSLDKFKILRTDVEFQLNKDIKKVKSDHSGEYYDRNDCSIMSRTFCPLLGRVWDPPLVHYAGIA